MDFRKNRVAIVVFLNMCVVLITLNSYPYLFRPDFFLSLTNLGNFLTTAEAKPDIMRFEDSFGSYSTAQDLLLKYRFTPQEAQRLIDETRPVYNLNRVMAGNRILMEFSEDQFKSLRYDISDEEFLVVDSQKGDYVAKRCKYDLQTVVEEFYGKIDGSLWNTLVSQGEESGLVLELISILQWDVPFTQIQPGDSFKLIVEKKQI